MANLQHIRRRISSVQNTRKITKAMEMVAAAKLRRAQARIESLRPYAMAMVEMMRHLAAYAEDQRAYGLLREPREEKRTALVVMTGDRGLAGAFNANVLRAALEAERSLRPGGVDTSMFVVGRKGVGTLTFRGYELAATWAGMSDRPAYSDAQAIARRLIDLFEADEVTKVRLIYNHFKSPLEQRVVDEVILPIPRAKVTYDDSVPVPISFLYEPDATTILERLLPAYVEIALYRALLESSASEQGARMSAMRNASENAEEMIATLTLDLNRARQASITQEILEVIAGADALG